MTRSQRSCRRIRSRVFVPFGLALLGILAASCFAVVWQRYRCVCEKLETRLAIVTKMVQRELGKEAELMRGLTDFLEREAPIREAWLAGDRKKLLESSLPRFEEIYSKYRITHLYFHGLDKVCFLYIAYCLASCQISALLNNSLEVIFFLFIYWGCVNASCNKIA